MASSKTYLDFVLEHLSGLDGISYRTMMGEFILYYRGKIFGGVYDNRLLVKITDSSRCLMPLALQELPYEGGSPMLLVDNMEDRDFLTQLVQCMCEELPAPKKRK